MSFGHSREAAQMSLQLMWKHAVDLCKPIKTNPSLVKATMVEVQALAIELLASFAWERDSNCWTIAPGKPTTLVKGHMPKSLDGLKKMSQQEVGS